MNTIRPENFVPIGPYLVTRLAMLGGDHEVVYTVWEPSSVMGPHATISHHGGNQCYGQVGTRNRPDVEALPAGSPDRLALAMAHRAADRAMVRHLVHYAYPETDDAPIDRYEVRLSNEAVWSVARSEK